MRWRRAAARKGGLLCPSSEGLGVDFWGQTCGKTYGSLSIKNKSEHGFQSNAISVIVDRSCISSSVMSSVRILANGDDASTLVDSILLLL